MDHNEIKKYKPLFLKSTSELIEKIKSELTADKNITVLHRLFHNLKGQTLFMNLQETGKVCLDGEILADNLIKENKPLDDVTRNKFSELVEKIKSDLINYENTDS